MTYAELQVTTNFSFLRGGSHPDELVATAKALGLKALAITDRNTLAGVVRAHMAARDVGMRVIVGARLDLQDAPSLLCLPRDRAAYGRLCRLLTLGQRRAEKGQCLLWLEDVAAHAEGQIFVALAPRNWDWREVASKPGEEVQPGEPVQPAGRNIVSLFQGEGQKVAPALSTADAETQSEGPGPILFHDALRHLKSALGSPLYLAASHLYRGDDRARIAAFDALAEKLGLGLVASNDVLYHGAHRRPLQDVLTCIREKCSIGAAGFRLNANAERHLKAPQEIGRLFKGFEHAVARTMEIAEACQFSLDELVYEYPDQPVPRGKSPQQHLEDLTWKGAAWRYPDGVPEKIKDSLIRELALIEKLNYAPYFLTVYDIVAFARGRDIFCQGRGSAANSAVCYCIAITNVDPNEIDLLFDRFISPERKEPPDIDVDFEHERREEVIQYIYERYGRERAGLAATVITYRGRSAVREVGTALGLSEDTISALAGMVWGTRSGDALPDKHVREAGIDATDPLIATTLELTHELIGFPRHLSQHVGGFVLTRGPLSEVVPIANAAMEERTVIEWDKDDLDALGLLKVDVLGLGMLTCIHRCFDLLAKHEKRPLTLASVPREDPVVYDMLCRADSIGVFQVESRAQMNMLPRLKPRKFYDIVIEVAIVRPGPIQGDMVHPYLRRRDGLEKEEYPSPAPHEGPADELRRVLGKTKGVPLFQEQAMRIAMVAAKFSPEEVNQLRRAMATFRRVGTIGTLEEKMVSRMIARGYDPEFAARCFNQIKGFGEYGFPESHAASFAHLVYISSWLKCHYPVVFACGLLNSQPMGFYAPAQIVRDAREHGVEVRAVDVNFSAWDCTLEPGGRGAWALRLGLRQVDGLREEDAENIVRARPELASIAQMPEVAFHKVQDVREHSGVSVAALERLAAADAFRSLSLDRRQALWEVRALARSGALPLFAWAEARDQGGEPEVGLPVMPLSEHVVNDYQTLRMSLKAHPMSFLRERFTREGVCSCEALNHMRDGARVAVAGVVLVRQRPGSAKGVVFMTIEDETGVANAVVWPQALERFRKVVMGARLVHIRGRIQRHESIIHVVAEHLSDRSDWLALLTEAAQDLAIPLARADEVVRPGPEPASWAPGRHPRSERVIPKSRDFH